MLKDEQLSPEHIKILRAMSGEQRLAVAENLYWAARDLKKSGVRSQHPEWTEEQVVAEVNRIFLNAGN